GYLPGSLDAKIDPYVRPLYDALHDMIDPESLPLLIETGTIDVAPLAYMRGRTLNDAFIILDEWQNTTAEQMHMFLIGLGVGSRAARWRSPRVRICADAHSPMRSSSSTRPRTPRQS